MLVSQRDMKNLNSIYSKNLFFTLCVFLLGLMIPYARGYDLAGLLLIVLVILLYVYIGKLLVGIIKELSQEDTSVKELKFFFITLVVICAGGYFFIGIIDVKEEMISGLRALKNEDKYDFFSFSGFMTYFNDLIFTYLNSLYYSVVVMTTLGDSKIVAEGGFTRIIIGLEVSTALTLTIFKIGDYYSKQSAREAKESETKIINQLERLQLGCELQKPQSHYQKRNLMKLTKHLTRPR